MKKYRMKDVPRGQRWQHFWHYYGGHVWAGLLLAVIVGYFSYVMFVKPRSDFALMVFCDTFDLTCEAAIREEFADEQMMDLNGDGNVRVNLSCIQFNTAYSELEADTKQEVLTILSVGDNYIYLSNEHGAEWLREHNLLGTWGELGYEGENAEDEFAVKVAELPFFQGDAFASIQDLTLYITVPPEDETAAYQAQMCGLREMLEGK